MKKVAFTVHFEWNCPACGALNRQAVEECSDIEDDEDLLLDETMSSTVICEKCLELCELE